MNTIPVYFPMTYLSPGVEKMLAACFARTAVYRPSDRPLPETMQAAREADRLVVLTPVDTDSARLAELMDAYHAWAAENKGVDLAALKGRQTGIPFFEEASISRIRQDIKKMGSGVREVKAADPLFEARLFLEMAQALDHHSSDLEQSLDDVRIKETSMLADLLGDADTHPEISATFPGGDAADTGAYMTGTRIQAWWRLARTGAGPGNLLVTDSRAVIEHLVETRTGLEKIEQFRLPQGPASDPDRAAWQDRFLKYLVRLSAGEDPGRPEEMPAAGAGEAVVRLTLYRFQGGGAASVFGRLEDSAHAGPAPGTPADLLICLAETMASTSKISTEI